MHNFREEYTMSEQYLIGEWRVKPPVLGTDLDDILITAIGRLDYANMPVITVFCNSYPVIILDPAGGKYLHSSLASVTGDADSVHAQMCMAFEFYIGDASIETYDDYQTDPSTETMVAVFEDGQGYGITELRGFIGRKARYEFSELFPAPVGF